MVQMLCTPDLGALWLEVLHTDRVAFHLTLVSQGELPPDLRLSGESKYWLQP